jgi:exopolysaccharide biosynthesis protein
MKYRLILPFLVLSSFVTAQTLVADYDANLRKYGFKNNYKEKKWVVDPLFETATSTVNGYGRASKGRLYGLYDTTGKLVIPHLFKDISNVQHGFFWARKGDTACIYNLQLEAVYCNPEWQQATLTLKKTAVVTGKDQKTGLFTLQGKEIIPKKFTSLQFADSTYIHAFTSQYDLESGKVFSDTFFMYDQSGKLNYKVARAKTSQTTIAGITPVNFAEKNDVKKIILYNLQGKPLLKDTLHDVLLYPSIILGAKGEIVKTDLSENYYASNSQVIDLKWGIASQTGTWLLPPTYKNLILEDGHLYYWENKPGKNDEAFVGILSGKTGKPLLPSTRYTDLKYLLPNYYQAVIKTGSHFKTGIIDAKNKEVVPVKFDVIRLHSNKVVEAQEGGYAANKGVYTLQGKLLVPVKYSDLYVYDDVIVYGKGHDYPYRNGFIMTDGSFGIPDSCSYIYFHSGLLVFNYQGKAWLFSTKQKKNLLNDEYKDIHFAFGKTLLFPLKKNNLYGFVDSTGREAIPCTWQYAYGFSEGYAAVQDPKTKKYGYIDPTGKLVIACKYLQGKNFVNGKAQVTIDGRPLELRPDGTETIVKATK